MLGKITFNSSGITRAEQLGSGIKTGDVKTALRQTKKGFVKASNVGLTSKVGAQTVVNSATEASYAKQNTEFLRQFSANRLAELDATIDGLSIHQKHADGVRVRANRAQKILGQDIQSQLSHNLATALNQAEVLGMQQAYEQNSAFDAI